MNGMDADRCCERLNEAARSYHCCDAKMLGAFSDAFLSELTLFHEYDHKSVVRYGFHECYKILFCHADEEIENMAKRKWKPKNYSSAQIDYFIQDVLFAPKRVKSGTLFECSIDIAIAKLNVLCGDVSIQLLNIGELTAKERQNIVLPGSQDAGTSLLF